ncbi:MAG TPA: hypothetical protein DDW42_04740 [Desulfobacteraceae bacterium]|nr:hypothetical protein [Desulfobacteraceae bacterium]
MTNRVGSEKENKLNLKKTIERLETLPTLPKIAGRILNVFTEGDPDLDEVVKLIETDPAITMKILKLVNSAYFGLPSRISTIQKAVVMLGSSEIRYVLLSVTVSESLVKSLGKDAGKEQDNLWKHSLACAVCAEMLASKFYPHLKAEAFIGGLLHDVGKLILKECFPDKIENVIAIYKEQGVSWLQAEQKVFGVDHTKVGKWLAEKWNLPETYIQAIWLHHHPFSAINKLDFVKQKEIVLVIYLSNILVHEMMIDSMTPAHASVDYEDAINFLHIKRGDLKKLLRSLGKNFSERAFLFDLEEDELSFYYNALQRANQKLAELASKNGQMMMALKKGSMEKQEMEQEILKAQKVESIGILAAGIAHDFNNILTAISGNISLAKIYLKPEEKAYKKLIQAEKAFHQAKDLTQQLSTLSKNGVSPNKETISIAKLIKDTAGFALAGSNVRCEYFLPDDLYHVEVDEGQLNQVINNLVINAGQAMPGGGRISLRAKNVTIKRGNSFTLKEGKYIKISIRDQGVGIPKADLPRIFDPYFTTKEKGSGLGLATSYSIIKKHDGYINVKSEPDVGTTFNIYVPASGHGDLSRINKDEKPLIGNGKILIMDDKKEIRELTGELLKSIGYDVDFATDGFEAIEFYKTARESRRPFDAVIVDLTVPGGMGARETIQKLRNIDPGVKAIVSSGYTSDPVMVDFKEYGFSDFIAKPFKIEELSKTLQKTIVG